jgi:hypothetical protein
VRQLNGWPGCLASSSSAMRRRMGIRNLRFMPKLLAAVHQGGFHSLLTKK